MKASFILKGKKTSQPRCTRGSNRRISPSSSQKSQMEAAILSGLLKILASRMLSLVDQKYNLYKGFKGDAEFLLKELRMIAGAIDEQLLRTVSRGSVLLLSIEELRDLARDIEDCVDRIMYQKTRDQQASLFSINSVTGTSKLQLAKEMKKLRKRADEAKERRERYTVVVGHQSSPVSSDEQRCSGASDGRNLQADLVGIDLPREELLEHLKEAEPKKLKVISIVGFCGLGKTALARELYNNSGLGRSFSKQAWVSAAHGDPSKVLREIIGQLVSNPPSDASVVDLDQLIVNLTDQLTNLRYQQFFF